MTEIESYIYRFEGDSKEILLYFHQYFTNELNLMGKIRFKIPFYDGNSWVCYLNVLKNNSVELAFTRGNELSNEQGILLDKGRKQVRSLIFNNMKSIPFQALNEIMQEAILLDETVPYKPAQIYFRKSKQGKTNK